MTLFKCQGLVEKVPSEWERDGANFSAGDLFENFQKPAGSLELIAAGLEIETRLQVVNGQIADFRLRPLDR